jgi:hypothetical protein
MLYRNSHDLTGEHDLKIRRESKKRTYKIDWQGQIAFPDDPIDYYASFHAKIAGVEFAGIRFPPGTKEREAHEQMANYVQRPEKYCYRKRKESIVMLPPNDTR